MSRPPVVTISASYGAGGSRVGPLLAEHLDVAFVERAMPRGVAAGLEMRDLRIAQAMLVEDIDDTYVRHFYGIDPLDESLHPMVLDSTRMSLEACLEAIAAAASEMAGAMFGGPSSS